MKGRRGNTWSGGEAGEPHQWRSAGSASSSKEWHPGVEHEAEAGGGLDGEPAAADEGAVLAVAGAEQAEDEARSSLGRSALRSSLRWPRQRRRGATVPSRQGPLEGMTVGAGAYGSAGVEGRKPLDGGGGSAKEGEGEWGERVGGCRWGMATAPTLLCWMLDGLSRPFRLTKIQPTVEKSLPNSNREK